MQVAFITHYTALYGANRSLLNLIDGLKAYEVVPYVIVPSKGNIIDALQARNVEFAIIPFEFWVHEYSLEGNFFSKLHQTKQRYYKIIQRLYRNLLALPALANQLRAWKIDLVYTNSAVIPVGALVSQQLNLPHVWHLREFVDLDYNFHHDWSRAIFNYVVNKADAQIAISQAICSYYSKALAPERIQVIYNGVASTAEFDRFSQLGYSSVPLSQRPYTFALVGTIHPNKGQAAAIRALALLAEDFPHIRLLIVGKGETAGLQKLAHELGISSKVEFWGHIDEPYKAYLASNAVLMCSKNEGMGRVTIEAMSACRPVIGYDNAGTSELINHEYTGLLYQDGYEELAFCMKKFVENPDWARKLGENAWHIARREYSIEAYAQKVYQVLLSVAKISTKQQVRRKRSGWLYEETTK